MRSKRASAKSGLRRIALSDGELTGRRPARRRRTDVAAPPERRPKTAMAWISSLGLSGVGVVADPRRVGYPSSPGPAAAAPVSSRSGPRLPGLAGGPVSGRGPVLGGKQAGRRDEQIAGLRRSRRRGRRSPAGPPDASEGPRPVASAAQEGGRLLRVGSDPVEQQTVRLLHQPLRPTPNSRRAVAQIGQHQRGERESPAGRDDRGAPFRDREHLAVLGADVNLGRAPASPASAAAQSCSAAPLQSVPSLEAIWSPSASKIAASSRSGDSAASRIQKSPTARSASGACRRDSLIADLSLHICANIPADEPRQGIVDHGRRGLRDRRQSCSRSTATPATRSPSGWSASPPRST